MTEEYTVHFNTEPHLTLDFAAAEPEQVEVTPTTRPLTYAYSATEVDGQLVFGPYTEPYAEEGELRLYGRDGLYTVINWTPGDVIIGVPNPDYWRSYINLNTATNLLGQFKNGSNVFVPEGITFAATTNGTYMFASATNVSLPSTATFDSVTNASYMFDSAKNVSGFAATLGKATNFTNFAYKAADIDLTSLNPENGTNFSHAFCRATRVSVDPVKILNNGKVINLAAAFAWNSYIEWPDELEINLPACTDLSAFISSSTTGTPNSSPKHLVINAPNVTTISTNADGAGREGCAINTRLITLEAHMPKLVDWIYAFEYNTNLVSFKGTATAMTTGTQTFQNNKKMSRFDCDLPALSTASAMFNGCVLDAYSVKKIATGIKTWTSGSHPITIGIAKPLQNDPDVLADIAAIRAKGWTVTVQYNALS